MGFPVSRQSSYMYQTPSGYIFRFRVPNDLREHVGKYEFRYSLRSGALRVRKSVVPNPVKPSSYVYFVEFKSGGTMKAKDISIRDNIVTLWVDEGYSVEK